MKELITLQQANALMWAVLIAAPLIGAFVGSRMRLVRVGLAWGLAVGVGNLALWRVYNTITDRLGEDTVKNLLVNLGLFVAVGVTVGVALGLAARRRPQGRSGRADAGVLAPVGGPPERTARAARDIGDSDQPARDAG